MSCRCAWPLWTTDHVFSDATEKESFLPSARPSAQPDLSADGMFVPDPCTTSPSICCYQKVLISFWFFFIAAELSWSSGKELNIHTLPPSRGGEEEEEEVTEGSLTPVSNWEIWITLVKLHWYKHPLSWYIFSFCTLFSHFHLTVPKVIQMTISVLFWKLFFKDILFHLFLKYLETA